MAPGGREEGDREGDKTSNASIASEVKSAVQLSTLSLSLVK